MLYLSNCCSCCNNGVILYVDDSNGTVNVAAFDNLDFTQEKSDDQERKDEQNADKEGVAEDDTNSVIEVNPDEAEAEWDSLTDEEKAKLLEESQEEE